MVDPSTTGRPRCVILGAGGHAKVLIDCILARDEAEIVAALDPDTSTWGKQVLGVPVAGGDDLLPEMAKQGVTHFVVAVGGIQAVFERAAAAGLSPLTVVHPSAVVSRFAELGCGCQILPGAIVNAGARLGVNVIVNSGAIVEHDCIVGDHAHIATGARLASTVDVGALAHIGAGATIRQSITIGATAVVGAGAVVVSKVREGATVVGVPAKELAR